MGSLPTMLFTLRSIQSITLSQPSRPSLIRMRSSTTRTSDSTTTRSPLRTQLDQKLSSSQKTSSTQSQNQSQCMTHTTNTQPTIERVKSFLSLLSGTGDQTSIYDRITMPCIIS